MFLDEIGEMAPGLQAKLLRFLEEKAFKRVGGAADIRVRRPRHRRDEPQPRRGSKARALSRGSVLPAERAADRRCRRCGTAHDDIPLLVDFYVDSYNAEFRKRIRGVAPTAMERLQALRLARQRARAAQRRRARDAAGRRRRADRSIDFPIVRPAPADLSESVDLPAGRHRSRTARTIAGRPGARAQRLEPDARGNAAGLNRDQIRYRIEKFKLEKPV